MNRISNIIGLIKQQFSDEKYTHKPLRIGMVVDIDPSPFLLIDKPLIKAPTEPFVVKRTSAFTFPVGMHRLYASDDSFLQIYMVDGNVTEVRYFTLLAEINPASIDEWNDWLKKPDGIMGQREMRHDDSNSVYRRVWGDADWQDPLQVSETMDNGQTAHKDCQLYSRGDTVKEYMFPHVETLTGGQCICIYLGVDLTSTL